MLSGKMELGLNLCHIEEALGPWGQNPYIPYNRIFLIFYIPELLKCFFIFSQREG